MRPSARRERRVLVPDRDDVRLALWSLLDGERLNEWERKCVSRVLDRWDERRPKARKGEDHGVR